MHILLKKPNLLKELHLIQSVVEKKSSIPILSNVLLQTGDGEIQMKVTNLDVSVSTRCDAEVKKKGAICIPAKKFYEIVSSLPDAEIEVKRDENDHVSVVCNRSRFRLPGSAKEMFPEIPDLKSEFIAIPAGLMWAFIRRTLFAITNEESRYALSGAKFELSPKSIRMVATDGHRLSFIEKKVKLGKLKVDALIPKKTLADLLKLCAELEDEDVVEFGSDENHLFFKVGDRALVSRKLSGQFPNYEMVLPKESTKQVVIESDRIASAIRRVALMADDRAHAVKFEVRDGQISITSTMNGRHKSPVHCSSDYMPDGVFRLCGRASSAPSLSLLRGRKRVL